MPDQDMTASGLPLTSLQSVILTTGPFLFLWSLLRQYITRSGPLPIASATTTINSQIYALFSAVLAYLISQSYLNAQSTPPGQPVTVALPLDFSIPIINKSTFTIPELGLIYHYSKFYEYIDVFNLVADGKVVGSHMAFHHVTTPYLTYFRVLSCSGDDWRVFALTNTVHHALMYAYFGGVGGQIFRYITRCTGWVQLVLGLGTDVYWMYKTRGGEKLVVGEGMMKDEVTYRGIAILLLARYAMLFYEELKAGRAGMSQEEREKLRPPVGGQNPDADSKKRT